jgi:hypothetical protein
MKIKKVQINLPQMLAIMSTQKQKHLEWGRGTGKSTILGWFMKEFVRQMPRATFFLVGETYTQILNRTLPSTKEGLEMWGLYENVDYVINNQTPPKHFDRPFQAPTNYKNFILFSNGAGFHLVSQDVPGTGRGLNTYGGIGDEAALLDKVKLFNDVQTTNRAKKARFANAPLLNAEIYASTTPMTKSGRWFIEQEKVAKRDPSQVFFSRANALANKDNLSGDWFRRMKRESPSEMHYNAEVLNIRPKEITNGFYAQLNADRHYYTAQYDYSRIKNYSSEEGGEITTSLDCTTDMDLNHTEELIVSVDWGAAINSMVVAQYINGDYKVLKSFFVKSPKILDHLWLEEFLPYYRNHGKKVIKFYYDRNGNSRVANANKTYAEQAMSLMRDAGWRVHQMTQGLDPYHNDKYLVINKLLLHDQSDLPSILINKNNNPDLIIALENAEAKDGRRGIEKDKRSESRKSVRDEHATHLTDAFDIPIYSLFKGKIRQKINNSWHIDV